MELKLAILILVMLLVAALIIIYLSPSGKAQSGEKGAPIPPAVGSLWEVITDDPFPSKYKTIKVLETRSGWVRYRISRHFPDERLRCEVFFLVYRAAHGAVEVR